LSAAGKKHYEISIEKDIEPEILEAAKFEK